jgi:hypothetical protein
MSDLETRKKLLIAEGEVYRETLKLEIQNLRIYGIKTKRRMSSFGPGNPLLALGIPLVTSWLGRKRGGRRWGALAFLGWQLFDRISAALRGKRTVFQNGKTAAQEYLERKM